MKILGVDPGINGAIASYDGTDLIVMDFPTLKSKGRGKEINWVILADEFDVMFTDCDHAFIELVGARPLEGRGSIFKFGYATGGVRGLIAAHHIPLTAITPTKWKAAMRLTSDKDYSRTRATELFPNAATEFKLNKDNNKAEAALIAYYGYMEKVKEQGS
jgi:crossover junction endodeoxyribonuclease RuvC